MENRDLMECHVHCLRFGRCSFTFWCLHIIFRRIHNQSRLLFGKMVLTITAYARSDKRSTICNKNNVKKKQLEGKLYDYTQYLILFYLFRYTYSQKSKPRSSLCLSKKVLIGNFHELFSKFRRSKILRRL